ncbi:MAG: DNA recombination protein RmuC, partial [bacterium]
MDQILVITVTLISGLSLVLLIVLLVRSSNREMSGIEEQLRDLEKGLDRSERALGDEIAKGREAALSAAREGREEQRNSLKEFGDSLFKQLSTLSAGNEQRLDKLRETVEGRLRLLQEDNTKKLEQMRATVDEKLHATLERRLGESFKLVSERLELVHKGLGEMQNLAAGVGDLKRILTNVKTRGTWGEIQLGTLLEQIMSPEQYATNVATKKGSSERVEFAIRLPGRGSDSEEVVWLPIDAKFPQEDYQRLLDAQDQADAAMVSEARTGLERRIKSEAKAIREKYLDPPNTTDFGILFLPTEGLYAEVLRTAGLSDSIQREHRVVIAGPTTLGALLNSLQMGFRTLAIEKRSSEVWRILGAIKSEFGKFGDLLEKTHKKLQEASNVVEDASRKSRAIERKLRDVQELPAGEATDL